MIVIQKIKIMVVHGVERIQEAKPPSRNNPNGSTHAPRRHTSNEKMNIYKKKDNYIKDKEVPRCRSRVDT